MDRSNKYRRKRNHKAKKAPKVPIKTYRWEDIRRARRRGGYPWTHLYKGPCTEKVDPAQFTMDAFRRSKSSSPMGRRSDNIEISEVSSWADYSGKTTPTLLHELISEPSENVSTKNSRPGSVVIEECVEEDDKDLEDDVQVKEFQTESAESSDNVSQYLDGEERSSNNENSKVASETSKDDTNEGISDRRVRAKSEETPPRKRKLSAESGQSRYSLSKLGVVKKLQDIKNKIKIPKISFPSKKIAKKRSSPPKEEAPKKEAKKDLKKVVESSRARKTGKPVYIHIPLKPPPGLTDEFSHLEFENKRDNGKTEKSLDTELRETEVRVEKPECVNETMQTMDEPEIKVDKSPFRTLERGPRVTKKPPLKINPAFKQLLKDVRQLKDKELTENQASSREEEVIIKDCVPKQEPVMAMPELENKPNETIEEIPMDLEERETSDSESPKEDVFDKLFEASDSRKEDPRLQQVSSESETHRHARSKSAEPQNKRRSSLDSSYSRKSLSRLGIIKKIRDASQKIKNAFSMDSLRKKKEESPQKGKQAEEEGKPKKPKLTSVVKAGQLEKPKKLEPVYIHIPLKPPEGQMDEFSYLGNESATVNIPQAKEDERTDSLDSTSPKTSEIQFIFLTPPSDDEILDKEPDIPETPSSSDDVVFFSSLKKLAQDAVDQVSPETKRRQLLEPVSEENERGSSIDVELKTVKETNNETTTIIVNQEPAIITSEETLPSSEIEGNVIVVDVEDGLSETPAKTEENLKSALKTSEIASPKRVSFKRKSKRAKDKDNEYEIIELSKEEKVTNVVEEKHDEDPKNESQAELDTGVDSLTQDISGLADDKEKRHLDSRIPQDSSLKEDFDKYSNIAGDHEYEPISPPEEVTTMTASSELPNITVVADWDTDPKIIISATEILDKPLEEKKKPFFQFGGMFHKDKSVEREKSQERRSPSRGKDLPEAQDQAKASPEPNKFQTALKQRAEQLKTKTHQLKNKIQNIKRPTVQLPKAPQFKRPNFKIEKPKLNLHLPKIPDRATIRLPHISLPGARKTTKTRTVETRQFSTESSADDSEDRRNTKRHKFDLSFGGTFPRFRKTKKAGQEVVFATVPRTKNEKDKRSGLTTSSESGSVRIPLHSEDSAEGRHFEEDAEDPCRGYEDRETFDDIRQSTGQRFSGNVAVEDEYERENRTINRADYLNRWQRGNFRERQDYEDNEEERIVGRLVEQRFGRTGRSCSPYEEEGDRTETLEERLRRDDERPRYVDDEDEDEEEFDIRLIQNKHIITDLDNLDDDHAGHVRDENSSEGSERVQRKGRLGKLDIDSDEFFVVHEIREGFQTPANALAQMNEYDPIGSNRSLPTQMLEPQEAESRPITAERKMVKKPKRKKTPHVSREEIPGDEESLERVATPPRPKRRSKRWKKGETIVPYQETIALEGAKRLDFPRESLGILGDDEGDDQEFDPDISPTSPYRQFQEIERGFDQQQDNFQHPSWSGNRGEEPSAPPRKHRSLKSLTQSENESTLNVEDEIIRHQADPSPSRPSRRSRSHTSSLSRVSPPPNLRDTDSILTDEGYLADNQPIPSYLIENQNYKKQYHVAQEVPSYSQADQDRQPCVEEPCVQDLRDYMGYSIVDKSKSREPPLPPPRTPPRRKKREVEPERKFSTVPLNVGQSQAPPVRPLRNYSTLSHVKSSKTPSSPYENDKENQCHISQYIEIEDEVNKDLVSGEVLQKMRQRPLPAPPRPPRKQKITRKSLQDITSKDNIISAPSNGKTSTQLLEETVSTQTEPLPPDFICEEIQQEPTDTIITPRINETVRQSGISDSPVLIQRFEIYDPRGSQTSEKSQRDKAGIRRELITPSVYSFEETVTHGTLLVQPIEGAKVIQDHQLSRERLVPITREFSEEEDDDETSEMPESFKQLKSPVVDPAGEKAKAGVEKLQVSNLDVDHLSVNQLLASKIVVSEIDASTISTNEIQGKSGTIKLGDVELSPELLEQLVRRLETPHECRDGLSPEQKKTSIVDRPVAPVESPIERQRGIVDSGNILSNTDEITFSRLDRLQQEILESPIEYARDRSGPSEHHPRDGTDRESSVESTPGFQRVDLSPKPPMPPPRGYTLEGVASSDAPPRSPRTTSKQDCPRFIAEVPDRQHQESESIPLHPHGAEMLEPDVDDQPPPRPPQPQEGSYFPSQPPPSFYALRAKQYVDENIPTAPRRKRQHGIRSRPVSRSRSTSDDSSTGPLRPSRMASRRFSESSIPELSSRLVRACGSRINNTLKRLIFHFTENLVRNADGNQDLHVFMLILLVLIAGLILLGYGEDRTVVHLHHWEYFNPPKDI